jgi:hypothetical protein
MSGQYVRYPNHVRVCYLLLGWWYLALAACLYKEMGKPRKKETYMSKTLSRKGIAFGAMIALGASLFAGAPAQANASGPLTLLPNGAGGAGATYTSLIGAGLTLSSTLDADKQSVAVAAVYRNVHNLTLANWQSLDAAVGSAVAANDFAGVLTAVNNYNAASDGTYLARTGTDGTNDNVTGRLPFWTADTQKSTLPVAAVDPLLRHYYLVENAAGASITLNLTGDSAVDNFYLFNADGDATGPHTTSQTGTTFTNNGTSSTFVTTAKKIAVHAGVGSTAGARTISPLKIDVTNANATTGVKVKVTSFTDTVFGNAETTTAKINNGEWRSATQEVSLLPAASVAVTTAMSGVTDRTGDELRAVVTLGSSVNPYAAASSLGVVYYKDGTNITLDSHGTSDAVSGAVEYHAAVAGDVDTDTGAIVVEVGADGTDFLDGADLKAGVYTARAIYIPTTPDIYVGARSVALDLRDGTNATVTSAKTVFTESDNVAVDGSNNAAVREGTKSLTVVGQILKTGSADLKAAGVRVRATVTGVNADEDTEITVTGSTSKIDEDGGSIVVFGFTDSNGQFPITINSTTGEDADQVTVKFDALLTTGLYAGAAAENITWEEAVLQSELEVTPSEYLTGATVNVTFTAVDQFGVGMDQTATGRVSIRVDAYVDGAVKTATYSETKATTTGAASFSFANFATAGSNQEIKVTVFQASTAGTPAYYTVYNNVATSAIAVADVFENRVQYVDYVTGKTTDAATLKAATDAGVIGAFTSNGAAGQFANIVGTALDANNAGQPGVPVTIAAEGVLFHDAETATIAKDSITVFANGQGFFDVQALSQKVNAAGATVTITAGGVSKTTLLKSYLADSISAANLKFSWALPATIVKDTTYSVVATLTDVWGNPIRTLDATGDVYIYGEGALQVNGEADINRNFNASGQSTFFIRSVATIGGPGTLGATLDASLLYATGKPATNGTVTDADQLFATDVTTTSWDERLWSGALAVTVDVLDRAPAPTGKVNVGSFNGKLVVYAAGLDGAKISWKVAGRWGTAVASGNLLNRFDRPVGASGVNVIVEIYVNGVKQLTKTVLTR